MKARAVRLHAANDLRLDTFELPEIRDDEILVKVVSDSICMSTYKCAILGTEHKRVHPDVAEHPAIMGHEFAGDIVKVGAKHQDKFKPGMKFTLQPALNYKGTMWSPGYSYEFFGGDATYCIIPAEVMELGCLLEYKGRAYYEASLAEPMSCSIGAFNAAYHTKMGVYHHEMGIKQGGKLAIMAGAGPMGLGALTYALHRDVRPSMVVVTDVNEDRLARAEALFPPAEVKEKDGIDLHFVNTGKMENPAAELREMTGGTGFDDVFCYAPVAVVVELCSAVLGRDGCLNFFAGPTDKQFSAKMNFYDVHYNSTHVMGTTGGNTADMIESLELTASGRIDPAVMVTHIGGLDAAAETTLNLPKIPGGKKLIYTHLTMPLTALTDLRAKGAEDARFTALADIVDAHSSTTNWRKQPMEQRRNAIVELVNREGSLSFVQLKEAFPSVSEMTLRTDLKALDQARRVVRVHGGVKSVEVVVGTDDQFGRRTARNASEKQIIAEKAAALLRPNTTVFLDSGSTATAVARCVPDEPMLIFTSGLTCAIELARLEKPKVSIPGGTLNRFSHSVCGVRGIQELEGVHFDLLLLGVTSYSPETGFACGVEEEALLKQTVLHRAEHVAVLLDSSKIDRRSTFRICGLDEVDTVISDGRLLPEFLSACENAGVKVL